MTDFKCLDKVIEAICCNCPFGVTGCVDVTEEHCGGCMLFPMKNGTTVGSVPALSLTVNATWLPCTRCHHATLKSVPEDSSLLDVQLNDIMICLNCPAKQLRDCLEEGCAEAACS